MRSVLLINLLGFIPQAQAKDFMDRLTVVPIVDRLLDRTVKVPLVRQTDVDSTTFGKPQHLSVPLRSSPHFAAPPRPASPLPAQIPFTGRPRPLPNMVIDRLGHSEDFKHRSSVHPLVTVSAATSAATAQTEAESATAASGADLEAIYGMPPVTPKYGQVEEIHSEEEFDNILQQSSGLVVLEVVSKWCRTCKSFAQTYQRMAIDYYGKASFLKVVWNENESTNGLTMTRLESKRVPSFFVFLDGKLVAKTTGGKEDALRSLLDECIRSRGLLRGWLLRGTPEKQPAQVQP